MIQPVIQNIITNCVTSVVLGTDVDEPDQPIPLTKYNLLNDGYSSSQIDVWFNGIVALGEPYPSELTVVGNDNPTSASQVARQTLFDAYTIVNYNQDYTP